MNDTVFEHRIDEAKRNNPDFAGMVTSRLNSRTSPMPPDQTLAPAMREAVEAYIRSLKPGN